MSAAVGGPAQDGYRFLKGHGTENDFVLLPDHDATIHGELDPARVRALCDRRAGLGADGVLRVVRAEAGSGAEWFMDYRNADGSVSEMCGNGVRVFALHLVQEGLVDACEPVAVGTRDGVKTVCVQGERITVDMGEARVLGATTIAVATAGAPARQWSARHVETGNPHAVVMVDDLAQAGPLLEAPGHDRGVYPDGVNVEFVARRGEHHLAMRVHERGAGETRSCGTGACAAMVVAALEDGDPRDVDYRVDLPGGTLSIRRTAQGRVLMSGPALIVAQGTTWL